MKASGRVLLVEDNEDIRRLMTRLIRKQGFEVVEAMNGQLGLEILKNDQEFNLIILDLMMPVMDGFEFRQRQLADPTLSAIPVLVMSADGRSVEQKVRLKVDAYLTKPIQLPVFLQTFKELTS